MNKNRQEFESKIRAAREKADKDGLLQRWSGMTFERRERYVKPLRDLGITSLGGPDGQIDILGVPYEKLSSHKNAVRRIAEKASSSEPAQNSMSAVRKPRVRR